MKAQFRVLSGARKGQADVFSKSEITAGRHPACDLKFDPEQDLDVSGKHAAIVKSGSGWTLRDLQSRNGVLLNGHRIHADTHIDDTDQIQFGANGPKVEFRTVPDSVADTRPPVFTHRPSTAGPHRETGGHLAPHAADPQLVATGGDRSSTTQRIRIEVAKQTKKFKGVALTLAAILVLAVAGFFVVSQQQEQAREREIATMRARSDSTVKAADQAVRTLQGQMAGLADALHQSQAQVTGLQTQLATAQASGNSAQITQLRRQLDDASQMMRNQQVVYGKDGLQRPAKIAVQFADSPQHFRADVLSVAPDVDLAMIRVSVAGKVPVVKGLSQDAPRAGDPVALIGYPLGLDLPMMSSGGNWPIAKTTFTAGSVSKILPEQIQIDGYGAEGASGSPIFDKNGGVIGVLFGGEAGTNGRIVFGVPVMFVNRLLQTID